MDYKNLVPMHDIVVIKPIEVPSETASGITLTTSTQELPDQGIVISVGPGRYFDDVLVPTSLTPGDRVLYVKGSGAPVSLEDDIEPVILLTEANVIAKII